MGKDFSVDQLHALIEAVAKNDIGEFLYENGETKLRIRGRGMLPAAAAPASHRAAAQEREPTPLLLAAPVPDAVRPVVEVPCILSPIVGTFYNASAPDKEPFVKVGQLVQEGDIVFIVESMKVMNEIPADKSGVVAEILVANGAPVEYGQAIMRLE